MHPILGDRRRLLLHLTAWGLAGAVLALLLRTLLFVPWSSAILFALPLTLVAAPVSLSAWYLCRAMPLARTSAVRIAVTAVIASLVTASLWAAAVPRPQMHLPQWSSVVGSSVQRPLRSMRFRHAPLYACASFKNRIASPARPFTGPSASGSLVATTRTRAMSSVQ